MPFYEGEDDIGTAVPSLEAVLASFESNHRSLPRDVDMEDGGTVRISTRLGAHLTSEAVIDALRMRHTRRRAATGAITMREEQRVWREVYNESADERRRLISLAPQHEIIRERLVETRRGSSPARFRTSPSGSFRLSVLLLNSAAKCPVKPN